MPDWEARLPTGKRGYRSIFLATLHASSNRRFSSKSLAIGMLRNGLRFSDADLRGKGDIERDRLRRPLRSGNQTLMAQVPKLSLPTSASEQIADLAAWRA